jgi:hypothetical protein
VAIRVSVGIFRVDEHDNDTLAAAPVVSSDTGTSRVPPTIARLLVKALADSSVTFRIPFFTVSWHKRINDGYDRNPAQTQFKLLQELTTSGIDPRLFDLMLSNELDRNLKRQFGVAFFIATIFFTLVSFAIIILNSTLKWGISDLAITSLIVETPIQFIGLLYIIARNLFPQSIRPGIAHVAAETRKRNAPSVSRSRRRPAQE